LREEAAKLARCLSTKTTHVHPGGVDYVVVRIRPRLVVLTFQRFNDVTRRIAKSPVKRHSGKLLFAALALIPVASLAQNPAPTPRYSEQAELSKVEEWVLSQGTEESIAPELAAILGLGSDRLPVKLKSFLTPDGINLAFAVSTNPKQKGIVISALKTIADKMEIYSVGNAWLTDRSGTLRQTIAVDASGARVLPNSSRAAKFKDIKDFFIKKLQATNPTSTLSPSPRISATAVGGKKEIK
jgi:hypothetical protein